MPWFSAPSSIFKPSNVASSDLPLTLTILPPSYKGSHDDSEPTQINQDCLLTLRPLTSSPLHSPFAMWGNIFTGPQDSDMDVFGDHYPVNHRCFSQGAPKRRGVGTGAKAEEGSHLICKYLLEPRVTMSCSGDGIIKSWREDPFGYPRPGLRVHHVYIALRKDFGQLELIQRSVTRMMGASTLCLRKKRGSWRHQGLKILESVN